MSILKRLFSTARRRKESRFPANMVCRLRHTQSGRELNVDLFEISKRQCAFAVQGFVFDIGDEIEIQIGQKSSFLRGVIRSQIQFNTKHTKSLGLASYRYSAELIDELPSFRHVEQI